MAVIKKGEIIGDVRLYNDMREFIVEKIFHLLSIKGIEEEKRADGLIPQGKWFYDVHILMGYKTQHPDGTFLQIEAEDFENWRKLKRTVRPERMDYMEKGARIGKSRECNKKAGHGLKPTTTRPRPKPRP